MALLVWVIGIRPDGFQPVNVLWALGLAVFATLLGHTMISVSLKYFKAPTVSAVMLVTILTTPLAVLLVLGEAPSRYTVIGGGVIIVGLIGYLWAERRDARVVQAAE